MNYDPHFSLSRSHTFVLQGRDALRLFALLAHGRLWTDHKARRWRGLPPARHRLRVITPLERPHRRPPPSEIQLHVDPERTEARRLYEAFGFQRAALLAGYYSDNRDALLMRRVNAALSPTKQ